MMVEFGASIKAGRDQCWWRMMCRVLVAELGLERGIPVTYVTFSDEGQGFVRQENRFAFLAVAEAFLAAHLAGVPNL
jgi:hypothetical protein